MKTLSLSLSLFFGFPFFCGSILFPNEAMQLTHCCVVAAGKGVNLLLRRTHTLRIVMSQHDFWLVDPRKCSAYIYIIYMRIIYEINVIR